jgi:hypothetical protein
MVVLLVGGYVGLQLIADVAATRLVQVGNYAIPAGTFIFALTFTWRDLLHKRLGKEWAIASILVAAAVNLVMAIYLQAVGSLGVPAFVPGGLDESWRGIFAFVPAIVVGSICAEVVSEWVDTEVYHRLRGLRGKAQGLRVLGSNAVSLPLDSIIFGGLAFVALPFLFGGEPLPLAALPPIVIGQVAYKAVVTLVSLPLIYLVPERQGIDPFAWSQGTATDGRAEGGVAGYGRISIGDET